MAVERTYIVLKILVAFVRFETAAATAAFQSACGRVTENMPLCGSGFRFLDRT